MFSPDPVVQFCVEEALLLRARVVEHRETEHELALQDAHRKAQEELKRLVG